MTRTNRATAVLASGALLVGLASGCGSSNAGSAASPGTYTIGLLTDRTGPVADPISDPTNATKATIAMFNAEGYHLRFVVADAQSSISGELAAAHQLVQQDHVFAVDLFSALGFAAEPYLASVGVPVIGTDLDGGTPWATDRNFFSATGAPNLKQVETTTGSLLNLLDAKDFSAIGYSISPSSSDAAKGAALSAQNAGIKVGYLNTQFPFNSTNVGPAVISMRSSGVDSFLGEVEESTSLAIISGARQEGIHFKAAILGTGYGDITQQGAAAEAAAAGAYFSLGYEPVQMSTAATKAFAKAMQTYGQIPTSHIDSNDYLAYMSIVSFIDGLKAAGHNPSPAQFIDAMLSIRNFNGASLYGAHTIGFALNQRGQTAGPDNCEWLVQWTGTTSILVKGADPVCGTVVPGKTA